MNKLAARPLRLTLLALALLSLCLGACCRLCQPGERWIRVYSAGAHACPG
jgi:hypothetical protein